MKLLRRAYTLLRSRKLAIGLIGAFIAYAVVATITADKGDYGAPYASPIFIAISAALTLATAACAWERTAGAVRAWRAGAEASQALVDGLRERPSIAVAIAVDADDAVIMDRLAVTLRGMRLRVRTGRNRLLARSTRLGLLGSPIFHWSLVLLFVIVALGQLTRSEGLMGISAGTGRIDSREAYGTVTEGPWHTPDFTGLTIVVPEVKLNYMAGGVDRGASPLVEVYDGDRLITRHQVYPNSPLRYRSLLIHATEYGLAARYSFVGQEGASADAIYDFKESSGVAENAYPLAFSGSGSDIEFTSSIALDKTGGEWLWDVPKSPAVAWTVMRSGETTSGVAALGDVIVVGDGMAIKLESLGYYARLSVVDDWSVTPIYILFVLAGIGLTLALLLPYRTAWVMLVEKDGEWFLHANTRQPRGDRAFPDRIEEALRAAVKREGGAS
ncbi:MAG: cytochrome c biogenesis protein ResB [Coriobacteriia bacterium]